MTQIQADGFSVAVIRSQRRKTMALQVREGKACLRMPARLALRHGEQFVHERRDWLRAKLQQFPAPPQRHYRDGEPLLYMGQTLTLRLWHGRPRNRVNHDAEHIHVDTRQQAPASHHIVRLLTQWYKTRADDILTQRTRALSAHTGLHPRDLAIRTYRARWGSCRLNGDIQLNWKLVMAPHAVIDYVIIHELCHLLHHNHSAAFWEQVARFDPAHREHRAWLRRHGQQLDLPVVRP